MQDREALPSEDPMDDADAAASARIHAFGPDALGDADAVEVAARIRRRDVSAREVVEAAIARAGQVDPVLHGIVVDRFEAALAEADAVLPEEAFAGVPTFVKDNRPFAGLPTGQGSEAMPSSPAPRHGPYMEQFLSAGFLCLGKSALPEFGLNASTEFEDDPPTRNPWNPAYSAGASSGGAAVLVASGVVPIAHGNDGGGSIRIPAAACGLVGLKPSRGRHRDSDVARAMPLNIISEGVLTRSVRDTAVFHAELEKAYRNPALLPIGTVAGPGERRLRIGLAMDLVSVSPDTETRAAIEETARRLERLGHRVEPIAAPFAQHFEDDFLTYWGALAFAIRRTKDRGFDATKLGNLTRGLSRYFLRRCYKLPFVLRRMRHATERYERLFDDLDLLLTPALAHTTPELGHLGADLDAELLIERLRRYVAYTPVCNATGGPAIALPVAATAAGLPLAAHFCAKTGDERTLLELAFELEADRPWPRIQDAGSQA